MRLEYVSKLDDNWNDDKPNETYRTKEDKYKQKSMFRIRTAEFCSM